MIVEKRNNHSVYLCLWSVFLLLSLESTFTKSENCLNRIFRMREVISTSNKYKNQNHPNELYSTKWVFSSASDYPGVVFSLQFCLFSWAQKIFIKRQNWQSQILSVLKPQIYTDNWCDKVKPSWEFLCGYYHPLTIEEKKWRANATQPYLYSLNNSNDFALL